MSVHVELPVARPPWSGNGRQIESMIRKALWEYKLLPPSGKVAIALSGGKDSLTLLFMLAAISGRGFPPLELTAIQVSGAFSCGASVDEGYLRALCDAIGVKLIQRTSDRPLEELECYSCSRERRSLIFEAAKEVGADTVAFGHHRDDSAQTLLMNMLHKGEFASLLPKLDMVNYGVTIIRPLILVSEDQIREFAQQQNFARVRCRCPVGQNSMRRQVDTLIGEMEALYPNARANLARAGLLYGSDKARMS